MEVVETQTLDIKMMGEVALVTAAERIIYEFSASFNPITISGILTSYCRIATPDKKCLACAKQLTPAGSSTSCNFPKEPPQGKALNH